SWAQIHVAVGSPAQPADHLVAADVLRNRRRFRSLSKLWPYRRAVRRSRGAFAAVGLIHGFGEYGLDQARVAAKLSLIFLRLRLFATFKPISQLHFEQLAQHDLAHRLVQVLYVVFEFGALAALPGVFELVADLVNALPFLRGQRRFRAIGYVTHGAISFSQ